MPDPSDPKAHAHPYQSRHAATHTSPGSLAGSRLGSRGRDADLCSGSSDGGRGSCGTPYAELAVTSNFTFLTGASHPDEYVRQAALLGYRAIAITDRNSLAGVVRAHVAAKEVGIPLVVGCRLELNDHAQICKPPEPQAKSKPAAAGACAKRSGRGCCSIARTHIAQQDELSLLVYPKNRQGYRNLCRLLTLGKRRATKGRCLLTLDDVIEYNEGLLAVGLPPLVRESFLAPTPGSESITDKSSTIEAFVQAKACDSESGSEVWHRLREAFDDDRFSIALTRLYGPCEYQHVQRICALATSLDVPLVAVNDVHYHVPERRMLQDVLTCIRHRCTLSAVGFRLFPNGERYLKTPDEMGRLFAAHPEAIARSVEIAERAQGFNLDQLRYEYPDETCPPGTSPMEHLKHLTWQGGRTRYPVGVPDKVRTEIEHEFSLIEELEYAPYFLTVHDLVVFARSRGILCQGRGAAANSAVCYCLGVTSVDPDRIDVLFERFVSRERNEPPDIDIDFEHQRREEVIQYIYEKYGRDRAGLTAEVITYRRRSAIRDVGKALGVSLDAVDRIAKRVDRWERNPFADSVEGDVPAQLAALGFDAKDRTMQLFIELVYEIMGFPRHLSQHVGGFVITRGPLCEMVPIENAAMPNRTVIEWDKDDIDAMGMLKVDVLGLGMLTAIRKALDLINSHEATEGRSDEGKRNHEPCQEGVCEKVDALPNRDREGAVDEVDTGPLPYGRGSERTSHTRSGGDLGRGGSRAPGPDPKPGKTPEVKAPAAPPSLSPSSLSPSLRPSVASSLSPRSVAPLLSSGPTFSPLPPDSLPPSLRPSVASSLSLATIPAEDPAVYDMICNADTLGVFQIESRAQMTMLPRLKPRCFYDLVIEVAIVRPGPIVGEMVHPYLRRRNGEEPVPYFDETIHSVLGKTLGVPLFQEQVMALAIKAAGFSAGEAERLRRAITAWTSKDDIARYPTRFIGGMVQNGYSRAFAEWCFQRFKGFSQYGFPESHAASFALLVYASAWIKRYYPAVFAAALLNSQPLGFYAPAQIVRDAREHGVVVRSIDVNYSDWDCTLEENGCVLRLGMRQVKGLREADARAIVAAVQEQGPFTSPVELWRALDPPRTAARGHREAVPGGAPAAPREAIAAPNEARAASCGRTGGASVSALHRLALADAFGSMHLDRQHALWMIQTLHGRPLPLLDDRTQSRNTLVPNDSRRLKPAARVVRRFSRARGDGRSGIDERMHKVDLPVVSMVREVGKDYQTTGLSLKAHPVSFIRNVLKKMGVITAEEAKDARRSPFGRWVAVAGIVLFRQRPGTARGVMFMTLEDETGRVDLIVQPPIYKQYRPVAVYSKLVLARGRIERRGRVVHVLARAFEDMEPLVDDLPSLSRDFR